MPSDIIVVERCLLKSQAFRELSGTAKTVYFDFRMKCKMAKLKGKPGRTKNVILNNGELEYCYATAERNGITRPRFVRALDQLIEHGFIDIAKLGSGGHKGDKNKYAISERWRSWGTPEFEEKRRPRDKRKARGWSVYHQKKSANIGNENVTPTSNENVTPRYTNNLVGVTKTLLEKRTKNG